MVAKGEYKTRQKDIIIGILQENEGRHMTASEISERLLQKGARVGVATLYRCLERLSEKGVVEKMSLSGESARYTYHKGEPCSHFHLKCVGCGELICTECDRMAELLRHIGDEHGFSIAPGGTTLYGRCKRCMGEK